MIARGRAGSARGLVIAGAIASAIGIAGAGSAPVAAQGGYARRDVPAGEVTGLEASIEGALAGAPGGRVVWLVTIYEVVRRRELRPAADVSLSMTASFAPGAAVANARTDAAGRAELALALPDDLEVAPSVVLEAISPRGIRRTFDATVELAPRQRVELFVDRERAPPGGSVLAIGRVSDGRDGAMIEGAEVRLHVRAGGSARGAPRVLRTDARGVFSARIELPGEGALPVGLPVELRASTEWASSAVTIELGERAMPALWVRATPARELAAPGDEVGVRIEVRDPSGAPVRGARVEWSDAPADPERPEEIVRTDEAGRAQLAWTIDRRSIGADYEDRAREVRASHPGLGTASGAAHLRIARRTSFVSWAVSGGALAPGLPARVYARTVDARGTARAGRTVRLASSSLAIATEAATTDADGAVAFDVTLRAPARGAARSRASDEGGESAPGGDACGGGTAIAATLEVDGARTPVCLPVDPDATLAVSARAEGERAIAVEVARRADVARSPVVVTALVRREGGWTPVARAAIAPGSVAATLVIPTRAPAEVWIRARPVVGAGQEVRGGGALVWLGAAPPRVAWAASAEGASSAPIDVASTQALFAAAPGRAASLARDLRQRLGVLGAAAAAGLGARSIEALAAATVPRDAAASAVMREGSVEPQPLPDDAVSLGLLRDPWRTRARFVRGRLGAMMRAVEHYVDAHVPDAIDQVAVPPARAGGEWRFDREVLEAALAESGLGDERAAALDGEPLDIDALTALDPAFTYDHVAARITRERLFRVLRMLRELVRTHDLDLAWARRGDPRQYVVALLGSEVPWEEEIPERSHLFDGWGHPLALVPVRGRARFDFLQPVSGYELVSAGPDGRIGTRDDVVDPFARVLPSGGVYAEAVSEDVLLARLEGVALGRATALELAEVFALESEPVSWDAGSAPRSTWRDVPPAIDAEPLPPAPVPEIAHAIGEVRAVEGGAGARFAWALPRERRPYVALGLAFAADGSVSIARTAFEAGAPFAARIEAPDAMRPGERLRIPLAIVQLAESAAPRVVVRGEGEAVSARIERDALVLEARAIGASRIEVALESEGGAPWVWRQRVRVLPEGALRAVHDGAVIPPGERASLDLRVPEGARGWRARVVVGAPRALRRDPLFDVGSERSGGEGDRLAAIVAWADAIAGAPIDPEHLAALERAGSGEAPGLELACALIAWGVQPEPVPLARTGAARLAGALPADLGARAAALAALAPIAPAIVDAQTADPVASAIALLRDDGWRALATERGRPTVLARVAAGLLLADREDAIGRALFERAQAEAGEEGFDPAHEGAMAGTLALAIAARQLGDDARADALGRAALRRTYLARRLGTEAVFWALAASVYGALGASTPERAVVSIDGAVREVALEDGVAVIEVRPGARVEVRAGEEALWARAESRSVLPLEAREGAPIAPRLEGDVGRAGERAALELVVEATGDEAIAAPVVEIALPSAGALDAAARAALARSSGVVSVAEVDGAGVVRVFLRPLAAHGAHHVPLPIHWRAAGRTRGLSLVAYDAARPWAQTIRAARELDLELAPAGGDEEEER